MVLMKKRIALSLCMAVAGHCSLAEKHSHYWFVSVGSGFSQESELHDINPENRQPPALFGKRGIYAEGEYSDIRKAGVGLGWRVNSCLALELSYDYQSMTFHGNSNFPPAGRYQPTNHDLYSDNFLANAKLDLLALFGDQKQLVRPFINIAGGLTHITTNPVTFNFPSLTTNEAYPAATRVPGGQTRNRLFRAGTGIDWRIKERFGITAAYQFYDFGDLKTCEGTAYVSGHSCDRLVSDLGCRIYVNGLEAKLRTNLFSLNFWHRL